MVVSASSSPAESDDRLAHLLRTLKDRHIDAQLAQSPYLAMAHLVRHEQTRRTAPAPHQLRILLIATHPHQPENPVVDRLVAAAKRFLPDLARWRYAPGSTPPISEYQRSECEDGESETVVRQDAVRAFTNRGPLLRLAGDGQIEGSPEEGEIDSDASEEAASSEASILTEEELRLLLADDEDEQTGRGNRS